MRRFGVVAILAGLLIAGPATLAMAHPLGNFSINQYTGIDIRPDAVHLDYVVDTAEVPAVQELRIIDTDGDGEMSPSEADAYATGQCALLAGGLVIAVNGSRLEPLATSAGVRLVPGQAGLDTIRLECAYVATHGLAPGTAGRLEYRSENFPQRLGWVEVVATGTGAAITTNLPDTGRSNRLAEYPDNPLRSAPDLRSGSIGFTLSDTVSAREAIGAENLTPPVSPVIRPPDAFADLITRADVGPLALIAALGIAFVLGAGHALAPGHGKTIMAAYLVGTGGTRRQAVGLGLIVAASHTAGVLALAGIAFWASASLGPERIYPYLSALTALIILGLGLGLMVRYLRRRNLPSHDHDHHHGPGGHTHLPEDGQPLTGWRPLAALGLSGGLVPSASAVVLLLGSIQLDRIPLGFVLVLTFGLGMAATLVGVGMVLVVAGKRGISLLPGSTSGRVRRALPGVMAAAVIIVGIVLTVSAFRNL